MREVVGTCPDCKTAAPVYPEGDALPEEADDPTAWRLSSHPHGLVEGAAICAGSRRQPIDVQEYE